MPLPRALVLVGFAVLLSACPKKDPTTTTDAAPSEGGVTIANNASNLDAGAGDDVEPVYPVEPNAPAVPLATKLCTALSELPEKKRSECCKSTPGIVVTSECTRTLSAALRHRAVEVSESDVDACIAAFETTLAGCEWVGPFPPGPPPACLGIIKGRIGNGQKCRSSLECTGDLRCLGAGPTTTGVCGPPKSAGEPCGGTVDTLAGYARQTDIDKHHPECKEKCIKHRCAAAAAEGAACQTSADCAEGLQCHPAPAGAPKLGVPQRTCVAKPLPKEREPCPAGVCAGELQCIRNKCAARKPTGADCTADFECRGGCLKGDGGDKGKCGPRCDLR